MDFLTDYVSQNIIDKILIKYSKEMIVSIIYKEDNVKEVIKYFKSLGFDIETLLINRLDIFLININHLKENIESYNKDEVIESLKNDISILDYLLDSVG